MLFFCEQLAPLTNSNMTHERAPIFDVPAIDSPFIEDVTRYEFACEYVRGMRAIDIACGTGYGASLLVSRGGAASVIGFDISEDTLRRAHIFATSQVEFVVARAESIPIKDGEMDAAI